MVVKYCTTTDVQRAVGNPVKFSSTSSPTHTEVSEFIEESTQEIETWTRDAWRTVTVINEFYDWPQDQNTYPGVYEHSAGVPIYLKHRNIKAFTATLGDDVAVWVGNTYEHYITAKTEGRGDDWWIDSVMGVLYLKTFYKFHRQKAVRMSYRYGVTTIPGDIRKACMLMAAIRILSSDDRSMALTETGDPTRQSHSDRIARMQEEVDRIIKNRSEYFVV